MAVAEHPGTVVEHGTNVEVKQPMHVKNPMGNRIKGKWVAVAASGWQSGGIYVPLEEYRVRLENQNVLFQSHVS